MGNLAIIGSGPAGLTAALYAARANLHPVVFAGALPGGLLTQTTLVENFPGFPEGVQGVDLMLAMQSQAEKYGAVIENEQLTRVELTDGGRQKLYWEGGSAEAEALIIATGAAPRWLGLESETRLKNHGVSACATCDGAFYQDQPVVVAGGGDTAMEEALFLANFAASVTIVHRRGELRASAAMAERALHHPKIRIAWHAAIAEVLGETAVTGVRVRDGRDGTERVIPCTGLFVALGHRPETALFKEFLELDETGCIRLQEGSSQTTLAGVFAAGDCADPRYRQAVHAAGMGCRAALDAERYLQRQSDQKNKRMGK